MMNYYNSLDPCRDTGSKRTWRKKLALLAFFVMFSVLGVQAQVGVTVTNPTNTTPNLSASYASLASALTDLNAVTAMSGPVTLTLAAGSETAPSAAGFTLGSATLNPVLSATNTVTIVASGTVTLNADSTGTANASTATPDGIFKIVGADYVTLDGITFTDGNSAGSAPAMEFGVGLFKASATDGASNNTIKNCIFNMQRINNSTAVSPMMDGAVGILVINASPTAATTSLTPTAASGSNSNNKIYGNTINGGNIGIGLSGFAASAGVGPTPNASTFLGDLNNDIGGASALTGNTILNYGGGAATNPAAGIRANNQWSINISYNTVNNNNGSGVNHATTLRGIYAQAGTSANATISNNTITVKCAGTTTGSFGIDNGIGSTAAANTINITNNTVTNCTYASATTATFYGINTAATAANVNVNGNQITNNSMGTAAVASSCTMYGIYNQSASTNFTANNNTINGLTANNNFGSIYGIRAVTSVITLDGNTLTNFSIPNNTGTSSSLIYGYFDGSSPVTETFTNNNISNFSINGNGTSTANSIYGFYNNTLAGTKIFTGNNVNSLSYTSSGTGYASVIGIRNGYSGPSTIANNVIHTISSTGATPTVAGIYLGSGAGTTYNVYNNLVGNLTTPQSTGHNLYGIFCGSTGTNINLYYNTVYLNGTSTGSNFASSAVFQSSTTPTVLMNNNILVNRSTPTGTGITSAFRRTSATYTTYSTASNNNLFYAGTPSANSVLFYNGTTGYQTMTAYAAAVTPREGLSFSETVSATPGTFFQSFTGPATGLSTTFLHLVNGLTTQAESGGAPIAGVTTDFDGNTRNASTPDLGADEFTGTTPAPVVTLNSITPSGVQCTASSRVISVDVTTSSGTVTSATLNYSFNGTAQTPIVMTNTSGNTWEGTIPAATPANATVAWSVTATNSIPLSSVYVGASYADEPSLGVTIDASASLATICNGASTTLSVSANKPGTAILGTSGTSSSTSTAATFFPGGWGGAKTQYIVRASELTAAGLTAGPITALSFETGAPGQTYQGFRVEIGHTALASMTTALVTSGLNQVYLGTLTDNGYTPVNGVNTLAFGTGAGSSSSFNWDGTSNVVISICWSRVPAAATSTNTSMIVYSPGFTSSAYEQSDSLTPAAMCSVTVGDGTGTSRPKFTFAGNTAPAPSSISWSDGSTTVGTGNNLSVSPSTTTTYTATASIGGCPVTSSGVSVTVNPLPIAPTGTNSSQCGTLVPTASVSDNNGFTTPDFKWYADNVTTTALQTGPSTTYTTAISTTTTFYVAVVNPTTGCESTRTAVTVTVATPDAVDATASSATICLGESVTLTATNIASSPVQNYTYSWLSTAGSGATSEVSGSPASVTPTAAGTYTYTVTATDGGCVTTDTVTVTVNPLPTILTQASATTICEGASTNISALVGGPGQATVGAGGTTSSTYDSGMYSLWSNAHMQILITAADLTASGLAAGPITSVAFNVTSAGSLPMIDYSLKMAHTSATNMSAFVSPTFTTVYTNASFLPTTGTNTLTFSSPFNWDGTSNIVLEICHGNSGSSATMSRTVTTNATSYVSVIKTHISAASSAAGVCGNTTTNLLTYSSRPQMIFNGVVGTTSGYTFNWNPGSLSGANQTVSPIANTTYTVTVTNNTTGCSDTQDVGIIVNAKPVAPVASNSSQCGAGIPTASVSDPNSFTTPTFKWYADNVTTTALQTDTATTYLTSIAATTTFYVSVTNPVTGCESDRTPVTINFVAADGITITPSTTTPCEDTAFNLGAASANTGYVYTWTASPAAGSGIPTSMTGASINVTPTAGGTYVYTVAGDDGNCQNTQTVSITVVAPIVLATASPATLCAGQSTTLTATTPVVASGTAAVGAGATTEFNTSPYRGGANASKQQYLFTAAELTAAGIYSGNLTSISWTTTNAGSANNNYSIYIGNTTATSLGTTFDASPSTLVFGPVTYTATLGVNTHTFSTPFNWDGTSNIVVTVCHDNPASTSCTVVADAISGRSTGTVVFVAGSICNNTTAVTSNSRPRATFGGQVATYGPGTLTYTWNPGNLSGNSVTVTPGSTQVYTVSAFDSSTGCTATKDVTVTVNPLPTAPTATNSSQCGAGVPTASVADPNAFTTPTFKWYADNVTTTALQSGTSNTYNTSISATTTFYVSVTNPTTGCESLRTPVTVTYTEPDAIVRTPGATATGCANQPLAVSVSSANTNYVYTWTASPSAGSGIATSVTGAAPSITPTAAGTYVYTIDATDGTCITSTTITATITSSPSAISVNSTGSLCTGQILTLTATGGNAATNGTLGTGTTLNTTTGYPSPYSNYYGGSKHQMLIRASELTAMGMVAGSQLSAIQMNVSAVGSTFTGSLSDFQIAIGNTASTTLGSTSFEGGLTTVFGPTTQAIPTTGLPTTVVHTFAAPFTWNGTSNIVIQTAYSNGNSGTSTDFVQMTSSDPGFSSTNWDRADGATIATILADTTPNSSGNARPNMVLTFSAPVSKIWSPTTDLYTDAGATTAYTGGDASTLYFKSSTGNPVTYTVTADNSGCVTTGEIEIEPLPLPSFTVAPATICNGGSTSLSAVGVGNTYAWSPTTGLSASTGQTVTANPTVTTTYTVTATNNTTGCQSQETVTVTVNEPVVLTGIGISPVNPTVLDTTPVTFTANATGTGLTYQWYESPDGGASWNPMSGETNQTLVVTADAGTNDGYQYYCTITPAAPCASEDTGVATLTVSTLGFTAQPQNLTICSDDAGPAEMSVTATTDDPETTIEYAWEVSSDGGVTFYPVVDGAGLVTGLSEITFLGSATNTLEVSGYSATTPNLIFHCTLNGLFTSDDATLTINAAPAVTTSPSNQTVCAGGSTSFTAAGNASGDPVTYSWEVSTDGGTSWSPVSNGAGVSGATTATLSLSGIAASADGYQYHALVSGLSPCSPAVSAAATLTVINPLISVQPPVLTAVVQGNSTSISATATGATTYQWTFSNTVGGTYTALNENDVIDGTTYTNVTTQTLSIATSATSTVGNAYYYKLVATNGACSVTSNAGQMNITTYCAPPSTTFTSSGGDSDSITNVVINNLTESTNITQASSGAVAPWYTFYSTPVLNVTQGQSMSTAITFNTDGTQHSAIWVDWNRNGVFEASENVALSTAAAGGGATVTYNFTVPMTATPGNTRIRVRGASDSAYTAAGACATTAWGEVEDYVLNIVQAPACSGTPVAGTITSSGDICVSGTATLTVAGYSSGVTGISLQWYDGDTNLPISGQTSASYTTPTLTASHNYFVRVTCANGGGFADASYLVVVNNPTITGTTPNSRCGAGTVTLGATASSGTVNWYAAASGGTPLFTGNSYTTPVITTTTNYYVAASAGGTVTNAGKASSPGTDGSFISTGYGVVFTASTALTVQSAVIYPTGTGTITLAIQNSSGTEIGATAAIPVTGSGISTPVTVPIGIAVPAGTGYRLVVKAYTGITNIIRDFTNTFPYAGPVASVTGGWTGSASTAYYFFYNLTVSNACESARTMVTATVTPAPALTLSSATSTICAGDTSAPVTITSTVGDFDSYSWAPTTGVSGNENSGYTFNPTSTTTYTLTATNSTSGCSNIATHTVTVNPLPDVFSITPSAPSKCLEEPAVLLSVTRTNAAPVGGCLDEVNGQWPSGSYTVPTCNGTTPNTVTSSGFTSEYSVVNVVVGNKYTFGSSGVGDEITISDSTGTTILAAGPSPLVWYNNGSTQIRFYSQKSDCSVESTSRTRSVICQVMPGAVFSPTTGLYTNAAGTIAYTGTAVQQVYAAPTSTQSYTATATSLGCPRTANVTVTVKPVPTATAPATMDLCAGITTTPVALVGTPSGVTFDITGGAAVGLATQIGVTAIPAFTPTVGTATVTVTPKADGCTGAPVTFLIKVSPTTVGGAVTGGATVCMNNTSGVLTLAGHTGNVVRWESSVAPFSVWTPIANTSTTYTSGALTQTTQFRAVVQSGTCQEQASTETTVNVNQVTLSSTTAASVCVNTEAVVTLSGMVPNTTATIAYNKTGVPQTPVNVTVDGSGVATFNVMVTGAGQNVVITSITRTDVTPNCPITPSTGNIVSFVISTQCSQVQGCNVTLAAIDSSILANIVANVQGYRWRVTTLNGPNANLVQTLDTPLRTMKLVQLANYAFATQYQIEVATLRSGVWGPYSAGCTITTPVANTQLTNCSGTLSSLSDAVYANLVPYAAGYRFRITDPINGANTQTLDRSVRDFKMTMITNFVVQYGKTYNVEVAIKNTDGTYMAYSGICQVTTPVFPTTSLQDSQCDDYEVPSNSTLIYAFSYPGAIGYAFQLTGPGLPPAGVEVVKNVRTFTLNDFSSAGLIPGATYNVKVRLIFNLADPAGPYGKTCTIVTPGASRVAATKVAFNAVAFPNPFAENFNIDVTTSLDSNINVKVYDMTGRLLETREVKVSDIESLQVGDRYPSGVYNVIVTQGENVKTLRVIKR